jgi:hypothetical protein
VDPACLDPVSVGRSALHALTRASPCRGNLLAGWCETGEASEWREVLGKGFRFLRLIQMLSVRSRTTKIQLHALWQRGMVIILYNRAFRTAADALSAFPLICQSLPIFSIPGRPCGILAVPVPPPGRPPGIHCRIRDPVVSFSCIEDRRIPFAACFPPVNSFFFAKIVFSAGSLRRN